MKTEILNAFFVILGYRVVADLKLPRVFGWLSVLELSRALLLWI